VRFNSDILRKYCQSQLFFALFYEEGLSRGSFLTEGGRKECQSHHSNGLKSGSILMDCGNIVGVIILARKAWQSQHCSGLIEVSAFLPILGGRIVRVSPFSGERNDFKNQYFLIQYNLKKRNCRSQQFC
jgi:hypothetical protein